ncbi:hypothetical protein ACOSP7_002523 [Xanthoceras sorbifolium]
MVSQRCRVPSVVDNQGLFIYSPLFLLRASSLSLKRNEEIAILATMKYRRGNILSLTRMKNAGLANFPTPSGKSAKQTPSSLKRKLNDSEGWVEETMCAMALHSRIAKPRSSLLGAAAFGMKSPGGSPSDKAFSFTARSRQTRSGKGKTSTLTLNDVVEPVRTLEAFAAKSVTSNSATKVIESSSIHAFDKAASFACLVSLYLYKYLSYLPSQFCAYM